MLKLCILMDNELLYCGMENRNPCPYSSLYLSFFLSFKAKFVSQFSLELCKLESSNVVNICRISDCIAGLRLRVMAFIFLFLSIFMPPTSKKLRGHIGLGLSVRLLVCLSVRLSVRNTFLEAEKLKNPLC